LAPGVDGFFKSLKTMHIEQFSNYAFVLGYMYWMARRAVKLARIEGTGLHPIIKLLKETATSFYSQVDYKLTMVKNLFELGRLIKQEAVQIPLWSSIVFTRTGYPQWAVKVVMYATNLKLDDYTQNYLYAGFKEDYLQGKTAPAMFRFAPTEKPVLLYFYYDQKKWEREIANVIRFDQKNGALPQANSAFAKTRVFALEEKQGITTVYLLNGKNRHVIKKVREFYIVPDISENSTTKMVVKDEKTGQRMIKEFALDISKPETFVYDQIRRAIQSKKYSAHIVEFDDSVFEYMNRNKVSSLLWNSFLSMTNEIEEGKYDKVTNKMIVEFLSNTLEPDSEGILHPIDASDGATEVREDSLMFVLKDKEVKQMDTTSLRAKQAEEDEDENENKTVIGIGATADLNPSDSEDDDESQADQDPDDDLTMDALTLEDAEQPGMNHYYDHMPEKNPFLKASVTSLATGVDNSGTMDSSVVTKVQMIQPNTSTQEEEPVLDDNGYW
jgi:hypothetical protein